MITCQGGKPIVVRSISGVSVVNPLVAFYNIHGRKGEMLFFFLSRIPHETYFIRLCELVFVTILSLCDADIIPLCSRKDIEYLIEKRCVSE
jgi:hypothetical protein